MRGAALGLLDFVVCAREMLMSPEEETLACGMKNECYCIPDFGSLSLNALYLAAGLTSLGRVLRRYSEG